MIIDILDLDSDKPQSFKADWCTMISGNQDEFVMVLHFPIKIRIKIKVSVQGVLELGGHFARLCRELDFYEAIFFSLLIFKKKRQIF